MRYATLCSGIGAPEYAFRDFGWTPVFASEIDPFAKAVYSHHYPDTPIYGDFCALTPAQTGPIDFVVAGTPCQDFSVAGLRAGLAGKRGGLTIEFVRFLERYGCPQFLWENVPGVLSSDGGGAFGVFLGALEKLGYHVAWRILDAQHFGAPQRRRRVFVVGDTRDERAIAVLFEPGGVSWDTPSRSQAGEATTGGFEVGPSGGRFTDVAPTLDCRAKNGPVQNQTGGGYSWVAPIANALSAQPQIRQDVTMDNIIACSPVSGTLVASGAGSERVSANANETDMIVAILGDKTHALTHDGFDASEDGTGRGTPIVAVRAYNMAQILRDTCRSNPSEGDPCYTLDATAPPHIAAPFCVRRLTPVECEFLQSFPRDYTLVPTRTKKDGTVVMAADGPRYRALGNSMNTEVVRAIGLRIKLVNELMDERTP